jgi:glutamate carboxypeptidase
VYDTPMKRKLAAHSSAQHALQFAESHRREMLAHIRELVETESPSHDKTAVDRCGLLIAGAFRDAGARVRRHTRTGVGDIVEASFAPDGPRPDPGTRPPVLLLGHFDTVWDVGTLESMPCREHKGRLHGPGVYDMKAGTAIALFAIRALIATGGLPRAVTVLLTTDEEIGSDHSRELIEVTARRCAAVLVLEPSAGAKGAVKTARKGVGEYAIRVHGVASHAGLDFEKGQSAIVELARQIERISSFTDLRRGLTVSVGTIRGGTRRNVVPASAEAGVDVRIAHAADAARVEALFRKLKPFNRKCKLEVTGGINRPPLERTRQGAALYSIAKTLARDIGFTLDEAAVGGGSDGNFTAALGIPTLDGLGAVGEGAHAINESIVIDQLPRRVALLAGLLREI